MTDILEGGRGEPQRLQPRLRPRTAVALGSLAVLVAGSLWLTTKPGTPPPAARPTALPGPPLGASLVQGPDRETDQNDQARTVSYSFPLENLSASPVEVLGIKADGSGLISLGASPSMPFTVPGAGSSVTVTLRFRVPACSQISLAHAPLRIDVRRGRARATISLLPESDLPTDPWQQFLTRTICPAR